MNRALWTLVALALLLGGAKQTKANTIVDLYNTGVQNNGTLTTGGNTDLHYTYSVKGTPVSATVASVIPNTWLANGPASQWVGVASDLTGTFRLGFATDYQTTFTIGAGFDPMTATISGSIGAALSDSSNSVEIFLNGVDTGVNVQGSTATLISFSLPAGSNFVSGVNTLDFEERVPAGQKPGTFYALRVEMSGDVSPTAAPAPSSLALLGMATATFAGYFGWRRRKQAAT